MPTLTRIKREITLPEEVYDKYAELATKNGVTPEAEMVKRLTRCVNHTAVTPLYLTDDQRNRLSVITGRLINNPEDLITWVHHLCMMKVAGVEVTLDARLLSRIDGRRFGSTLADTIKRMVVEALEEKVGLR